MKLGRTEQWLLLAVLGVASVWVVVLVYGRLARPAEPAERRTAVQPEPVPRPEPEPEPERDPGPDPAPDPAPGSAAGPEMVFSAEEIASARTTAPAAPRSSAIQVVSTPAGARVLDTGMTIGRTPLRFPRPRDDEHARYLLVQKTSFRSVRIAVTPTSPDRIEVTLQPSAP